MPDQAARHELAARVEEWRRERHRRLREPMSWLSLVALEWLHEGENVMGTGANADLRLPAGPSVAGRLVRAGTTVVAHGSSAELTHAGVPLRELRLVSDADATEAEGPTLLELGALRACVIRRGERIGLRVWDTRSPALGSFEGIPHHPVDAAWRVAGRYRPARGGETLIVPDVLGGLERRPVLGTVEIDIPGGGTHGLKTIAGDDDRHWILFADATNGDTTYGGGRFVYPEAPQGERMVVDFNLAYNPPCAFSPYATCPLPPRENRLEVRVEAGELAWHPPTAALA